MTPQPALDAPAHHGQQPRLVRVKPLVVRAAPSLPTPTVAPGPDVMRPRQHTRCSP